MKGIFQNAQLVTPGTVVTIELGAKVGTRWAAGLELVAHVEADCVEKRRHRPTQVSAALQNAML